VSACGICGTDLHSWLRESPVDPAMIPGHEIAGVPLAGGEIPGLGPEPLVAVEPRSWCARCELCRSGLYHLCAAGLLFGVSAPGGLADWVDVPRSSVHAVPAGVSPLLASLAEPLAVAQRAMGRAGLSPASRVLVLGAGTIGLLCGLLAREITPSVSIVARHPAQFEAARALGLGALARSELQSWAQAERPDVVFETVGGRAQTLDEAVACCRAGGRIVVLGLFAGYRPFDARSFLIKELELVASNTYANNTATGAAAPAVAGTDAETHAQTHAEAGAMASAGTKGGSEAADGMVARGTEHSVAQGSEFAAALAMLPRLAAKLAILQTHQFPLERVEEAFHCAADKRGGAIKVTVLV